MCGFFDGYRGWTQQSTYTTCIKKLIYMMIEHAFQMLTQADQNHAWHSNSFTVYSKIVAILTQNNDKIVIQIHVNTNSCKQ